LIKLIHHLLPSIVVKQGVNKLQARFLLVTDWTEQSSAWYWTRQHTKNLLCQRCQVNGNLQL